MYNFNWLLLKMFMHRRKKSLSRHLFFNYFNNYNSVVVLCFHIFLLILIFLFFQYDFSKSYFIFYNDNELSGSFKHWVWHLSGRDIITTLSQQILGDRLLQVFNFNLLLKLLFCLQVSARNNLSLKICCKSIMKIL